ncbi:transcription termination/antitermination protein NusA [Treponema sp. OMZ 840]|uniref:transcription termination factor NusA n=1 Tax=Treponema sp. OMZ 840 TaxID=244313 RepID=UPI003D8D3BA7
MASQLAEAIHQLIQDKGLTEEAVLKTVENTIKAAYKRAYGTSDNCYVEFEDDLSDVSVYSRKVIVDGVYDPVLEIELEEALQMSPECEIGDEIDILIDPRDFELSAVQTGKQTARQSLSEIQKDTLMAEYKDKVGEIIVGYYQRERNGNIYVNLGNVEGILPAKFQSPREVYHKNDRIRALVTDVKKTYAGLQVVLSRTDPELVRAIVELEVPEIYDNTVEIFKIVREAGYRTKIAVFSHREDVDPVGACVGLKGVRIQAVIRELEGEKIDILRYDPDPRVFIKNALSPAEVTGVVILDEEKRQALAVVPESQFSLAIGKQGLNVRLANRLADWNIDVKTEEQYEDFDELLAESRKAAQDLFSGSDEEVYEIASLSELPGVDQKTVDVLSEQGISDIQEFMSAKEEGRLDSLENLSKEDIDSVAALIEQTVEFVEDSAETDSEAEKQKDSQTDADFSVDEDGGKTSELQDSEDEEYECPECGAKITTDMTNCPSCGIGLSFEYEDEE